MAEIEPDTIELTGLKQILRALKSKPPTIRVGILGSRDARTGKATSNATVGAAHEFGTTKIPQRSFLRVPLTDHFAKEMERSGLLLDAENWNQILKSGTILPWAKQIGVLAEKIVLDAFTTNGFGKWPSLNSDYQKYKDKKYGTGNILVATKQLRDSITHEVKP